MNSLSIRLSFLYFRFRHRERYIFVRFHCFRVRFGACIRNIDLSPRRSSPGLHPAYLSTYLPTYLPTYCKLPTKELIIQKRTDIGRKEVSNLSFIH